MVDRRARLMLVALGFLRVGGQQLAALQALQLLS